MQSSGDLSPVRIAPGVVDELRSFDSLAPLHQPHNLAAIEALAKLHARIVEESPFIWIAHDVGPRAMSAKIKGFVQPKSWFVDLAPVSID